jgi:branched-chain amino acid transport system substrate-binding protein
MKPRVLAAAIGLLVAGTFVGAGTASAAPSQTGNWAPAKLKTVPAPTGAPIKIGLIDPTSGTLPFPGVTQAAEAAVWYVNRVQGGVKGRPLQLTDCQTDGTPETNVNCANNFVQAKDVAVIDGFDLSTASELPILHAANIPLIGQVPSSATTDADLKSFNFGPPDASFSVGPIEILKGRGVKTFHFTIADTTDYHTYMNTFFIPSCKELKVTCVASYFEESDPNWPVVAQDMISGDPGVIGTPTMADPDCTAFLSALRSQGWTKQVQMSGCSTYLKALPVSTTAGTIVYGGIWQPNMYTYAPKRIQTNLDIYAGAAKAVGWKATTAQQPASVFSVIETLGQILPTAANPLTGPTVSKAVAATKNLPTFLGPNITCNGKQWPKSSACTNAMILLQVQKNGLIKPITNNGGFQPITAPSA